MSQLVVVFGATGQQGGSVIDQIVNDSELSKKWKIRGVTRDASSTSAKALKEKGVEVFEGDQFNKEEVKKAVQGAHSVVLITFTGYTPGADAAETEQGKFIADAAVEAGVTQIVQSGMTDVKALTNGILTKVYHFDSKAHIEQHIRTLPVKATYIHPGSFMSNYAGVMAPRANDDGTYTVATLCAPDTRVPLVDIPDDLGKWVVAALHEPDKYNGETFYAATREYTWTEIAETISKVTGKTVKYEQIPDDVQAGFFPEGEVREKYLDMFLLMRDFNYFGPKQKERVQWSTQQARGKITEFEEYLHNHPLNL